MLPHETDLHAIGIVKRIIKFRYNILDDTVFPATISEQIAFILYAVIEETFTWLRLNRVARRGQRKKF